MQVFLRPDPNARTPSIATLPPRRLNSTALTYARTPRTERLNTPNHNSLTVTLERQRPKRLTVPPRANAIILTPPPSRPISQRLDALALAPKHFNPSP